MAEGAQGFVLISTHHIDDGISLPTSSFRAFTRSHTGPGPGPAKARVPQRPLIDGNSIGIAAFRSVSVRSSA